MAAYKDEARGTWYVSFHYNDWTGRKQKKAKAWLSDEKGGIGIPSRSFCLQQATELWI